MSTPALETFHLGMDFGDFTALNDVSFRLPLHSFHGLLGENGAGKSTLVKCLIGYQLPSRGQYSLHGLEERFENTTEAHQKGLGMVYQQFTLVENMSVLENFVLVKEPIPLVVDWKKEEIQLRDFMADMPFGLEPRKMVYDLSAGEKQKLEILKQLYFGREILILDEPTSVLTPGEGEEVLGHLKSLTQEKKLTVLIITHKFKEVTSFCDSVSILRKGELVGGGEVKDMSVEDMAAKMVGEAKPFTGYGQRNPAKEGPGALTVQNLQVPKLAHRSGLESLAFSVKKGEILGVVGVSGNGQSVLMEVLSGIQEDYQGKITLDGRPFAPDRKALKEEKLALLPELPLLNAFVPNMSLRENITFRIYDQPPISPKPYHLSPQALNIEADKLIAEYNVKAPSPDAPIKNLSGGNVQRAVLGRELSAEPKVLIVSNPCFGLDFKATREIRQKIFETRQRGAGVLLVSEDLDEVMELADRILVMYEGKIVFETPGPGADREAIGQAMAGKGAA